MTSPVPDALRTQLAEDMARAFYVGLHGDDRSWAESAWDDMGGSEPSEERVEYVLAADEALTVLLASPFLSRARAEGAAEALREAAESVTELAEELGDAEDEAENAEVSWALGVARLRAEVKAEFMQDRAAALSAPTTTEGDPT